MNKPTKFMIQVTVNYSDDAGQALERRFNFSDEESYDEWMAACHKVYEQVRFTFGPEAFDTRNDAPPVVEEIVIEEVKNDTTEPTGSITPVKHTEE